MSRSIETDFVDAAAEGREGSDTEEAYWLGFKRRLSAFVALLEADRRRYFAREFPDRSPDSWASDCRITVKPGTKYVKVNVGDSGKYMVERDSERIYGIKAYGVIHKGHQYGTLSTIHEWDWSHYVGQPQSQPL